MKGSAKLHFIDSKACFREMKSCWLSMTYFNCNIHHVEGFKLVFFNTRQQPGNYGFSVNHSGVVDDNHSESWFQFLKLEFDNKGIDDIDINNILRHKMFILLFQHISNSSLPLYVLQIYFYYLHINKQLRNKLYSA